MGLYDLLPKEDKIQFRNHINEYSDSGALPLSELRYFLRYWDKSKENIYHAFGDNFIIKKQISINKRQEDINDEMWEAFYGPNAKPIIGEFIREYRDRIRTIGAQSDGYGMTYWTISLLQDFVQNFTLLYDNVYTEDLVITIPAEHTINRKPFVVNPNCKVVKILGKLCKAIGVSVKEMECPECGRTYDWGTKTKCECGERLIEIDGYEMFRQAHSRVLNNKKTTGNLCLSIHPMDYITMSDNDCGWDSCMSWMCYDEGGEYRLGTIEMMNSPNVIVAYLESSRPMELWRNGTWNSKRWRQLYIVDPLVILGNRQYPYNDDSVQGIAINWLREIFNQAPGYGPYPNTTCQIRNHRKNTISGKKEVYFSFDTCYMYNDVYDYRLAYIADQKFRDGDCYELNFSGPAVCVKCGDYIEEETVDAHSVSCVKCRGGWQCDLCGEWHSDCDEYIWIDDYKLCRYCYEDRTENCECCDDIHLDNDMTHVYLQFVDNDHSTVKDFNYSYYIPLCEYCFSNPDVYEPIYGKMYEVKDSWGCLRYAFDIRNITDEGLQKGNLNARTINMLKTLREAESDEDCLRLLEEIGY